MLRLANTWLLFASIVFYAWGELYLVWVMVASCLINYAGGLWCAPSSRWRFAGLVTVVTANLAALAVFKYAAMLGDLLNRIYALFTNAPTHAISWTGIALPLGISFYTFHGISYVVDVWREKVQPCRSLRDFMCYSTLFPQLVAGPIVRYAEVGHFLTQRTIEYGDLVEGARRFIVGLGKKVLIANQVSLLADALFTLPTNERTAIAAWLGAVAYAVQIYFDFSGYSDMAVGIGRLFGFRFPENFDYPYASRSIREFWRRWHMTLSRFFRDYLYIPLGGNRKGAGRTALNLVVVFALCGLWHGASWNFLIWGLYHGAFLIIERVFENRTGVARPWLRPVAHIYTLIAVLVGWVIFRCDTWTQTVDYFRAMVGLNAVVRDVAAIPATVLTPITLISLACGLLLSVPVVPALVTAALRRTRLQRAAAVGELGGYAVVLTLSLVSVGAGSHNPFIYFRF